MAPCSHWTALSLLILSSTGSAAAFVIAPTSSHHVRHASISATWLNMGTTSNTDHDDSLPGISSVHLRHQAGKTTGNDDNLQSLSPAPSRFLQGDELQALRAKVMEQSKELQSLRSQQQSQRRQRRRTHTFDDDNDHDDSTSSSSSSSLTTRIHQLERSILQAQQVDAEYVYAVAKQRSDLCHRQRQTTLASYYKQQALQAKAALPQFQLQGLWVGKFGSSSSGGGKFELINVTYTDDDVLVAHKVTGAVASGSGSTQDPVFSVPLAASDALALPPIQLQPDAMADAELWGGQRYLPRYIGRGRVEEQQTNMDEDDEGVISLASPSAAESTNTMPLWVDGQMILVSEQYFAFYWLGTSEQVFFGRPSPELTLKLLRLQTKTDPIREHLDRCWLETEHIQDDLEVDGYNYQVNAGSIDASDHECYYGMDGCFE